MPDLKRAWFVDQSPGRGHTFGIGGDVGTQPGKFYAEFQLVAFQTALEYWACVGFCGATFDLTEPIQIDVGSAQGANGCIYSFGNGAFLGWGSPTRPEHSSGAAHAVGDWIGIAIDTISGLSWVRNCTQAPTLWYGGGGAGTASPETGVEGYAFVAGTALTGNVYLCGGAGQVGNANVQHPSVRLNAGGSAFAVAAPTGFYGFNADAIFNSADMAPNFAITEDGLLLTQTTQITGSNGPTAFARTDKFRRQA